MTTQKPTQKPAASFRLANIDVTIWQRDANGKQFYSAAVTRSFTDKAGNWKRTNSFGTQELEVLIGLAQKAHAFMAESPKA